MYRTAVYSKRFRWVLMAAASVCMAGGAAGQSAEPVPLKPWATPLYYQMAPGEEAAAGKSDGTREATTAAGQSDGTREATTPAGSLVFVAITPCRLVDTRAASGFTGSFGPPSIAAGATRTVAVPNGGCGIPAFVQAYSFNVTVVPPGFLGFLTVYPTGVSLPNASTVNSLQGYVVANAAIVPAGTSGSVNVYASNTTDVVIDINGYFTSALGMTLAGGAAAAPTLSFVGSAGTGMWAEGANTVNFSTAGVNRLTVRPDGDVDITGDIRKNGGRFLHTFGGADNSNTGVGLLSMVNATTGNGNTAVGRAALSDISSGSFNTAVGRSALLSNQSGVANTALGYSVLQFNVAGGGNTAVGSFAMGSGVNTADFNTAVGQVALQSNTSGGANTALGQQAMNANTVGANNVAVGRATLAFNVSGGQNVAVGGSALGSMQAGIENTAVGYRALFANLGSDNTAIGKEALNNLTSGADNIAIGVQAGGTLSTGSGNIFIGTGGAGNSNNTIRIGNNSIAQTFIEGILGKTVPSAVGVFIGSNGQLGTISSSREYKQDIREIGEASRDLMQLRPVAFHYKESPEAALEYGLIAEEVAEIYPDLVVRDEKGKVQTVQYHKVNALLLNEVQVQNKRIKELNERLARLEALLEKR